MCTLHHQSLRQFICSMQEYPFPRRSALDDPFFFMSIDAVLKMPPAECRRRKSLIVGLGAKGMSVLENILDDLRDRTGFDARD